MNPTKAADFPSPQETYTAKHYLPVTSDDLAAWHKEYREKQKG